MILLLTHILSIEWLSFYKWNLSDKKIKDDQSEHSWSTFYNHDTDPSMVFRADLIIFSFNCDYHYHYVIFIILFKWYCSFYNANLFFLNRGGRLWWRRGREWWALYWSLSSHVSCSFMCLCICVFVFVYLCLCICVRVFVFVYLCLCICVCVFVFVYLCLCICVCLFMFVYLCLCICVCVCVFVFVYLCLCICVCEFVCVFVYVFVSRSSSLSVIVMYLYLYVCLFACLCLCWSLSLSLIIIRKERGLTYPPPPLHPPCIGVCQHRSPFLYLYFLKAGESSYSNFYPEIKFDGDLLKHCVGKNISYLKKRGDKMIMGIQTKW